jgi:uncharacterized membrane protein YjjP (DUF1212 family)
MKMKKFLIVAIVMATLAFSQMAHAAWYTCNLTMVTPQTIAATDTAATPAFTNRSFAFPTTTSTRNQFLAVALSAISAGKQVMLSLSSTTASTVISSIVILP